MSAAAISPEDLQESIPLSAQPRRGAEHKYIIALAVVLAALMQVIDSSIVNVALPDMMGNLGANLDEIVRAVNQVGAAPSDLVSILQALKEAGALHAELVVI